MLRLSFAGTLTLHPSPSVAQGNVPWCSRIFLHAAFLRPKLRMACRSASESYWWCIFYRSGNGLVMKIRQAIWEIPKASGSGFWLGLLDHIWKAWAHIQRREDTPRWPLPLALLDLQAVFCQYEQEKPIFKHTWKQVWHHHSILSSHPRRTCYFQHPMPLLSDHLKVHSTRGQQVSLLGRDDGWRQLGMLQRPWQLCWPKKRLWEDGGHRNGGFLQWIPLFWNETEKDGTSRWTEAEREREMRKMRKRV